MGKVVYDLLEYQGMAREITDPGRLYKLWDTVCTLYDKGEITSYFLDEMAAVVHPHMKYLADLEKQLNDVNS